MVVVDGGSGATDDIAVVTIDGSQGFLGGRTKLGTEYTVHKYYEYTIKIVVQRCPI